MECPACKGFLITVEYDQVEVDVCTSCRGVWLDSGELELILRKCGCEEPAWAVRGRLADGTAPPDARPCPICGKKMLRGQFAPPSDAVLDKCGDGDGLWFDSGELKQVLSAEVGTAGQAEIDLRFQELVRMADFLLMYKYIIKNVALKYGKTWQWNSTARSPVNSANACH